MSARLSLRGAFCALLLSAVLLGALLAVRRTAVDGAAAGGAVRFEPEIAIIGGGVTGLCAARRLAELGYTRYAVYEASDAAGGLARSHRDAAGFTWDLGVHVLFAHFEFFDRLLDEALPPKEWSSHVRKSPAFMRGSFVGYPVQDNLAGFPREEALRIIADLNATRADRARCAAATGHVDFAEWMHLCFGDELTSSFGAPYNYKVWARKAEKMNSAWVGERVATIDADDVARRFRAGRQRTGWGPNAIFRYPRDGTGAIWRAVADALPRSRLRLNHTVSVVDAGRRQLMLGGERAGHRIKYDVLLSTLPMDRFAKMLKDRIPSHLQTLLDPSVRNHDSFMRQSTNLVGFGMKDCEMPDELIGTHWLYFPEEKFPFYRATVLSNLSPDLAPKGTWSLLTESSESPDRPLNRSTLAENALSALQEAKMIPKTCTIVSTWENRLEYGYPVPYLHRDEHIHSFDSFLLQHGIYSRGRFGAWKYEVANQDHSCAQGVEAIDHILFGSPESTMRQPNRMNNLYTPHAAPREHEVFSRDAVPLDVLPHWTIVFAVRCPNEASVSLLDMLEKLVQFAIPDGVRFEVYIYEMSCSSYLNDAGESDSAYFSLRENQLHVLRVRLPRHIDSSELAFAYHVEHTFGDKRAHTRATDSSAERALPADVTVFVPALALERGALPVWLRCADLFAELLAEQPDFGVLADDPAPTTVELGQHDCAALNVHAHACPVEGVRTCVGPADVFYASRARLARSTLRPVSDSGSDGGVSAHHWRAAWHVLLGEPSQLDPSHCVPATALADGVAHGEDDERCPAATVVQQVLTAVAQPPADKRHTLVVTGGLGNIGLSLLRRLMADPYSPARGDNESDGGRAGADADESGVALFGGVRQWRVLVADNNVTQRELPADLREYERSGRLAVHSVDVTDYGALLELFKSTEAGRRNLRGVIHLGAISRVADCERNTTRCLQVNTRGTEHVVRALREAFPNHISAPWLVFASSREVFGDTRNAVVDEMSVQNPHNVYGASKAFAETYVQQHAQLGYRALVLRLANVYGSWEDNMHRVTPNFACRAEANISLQIVGGKQMLSLVHISDVLRGIELAMVYLDGSPPAASRTAEVVHLASSEPAISIRKLAERVVKLFNSGSGISVLPSDSVSVDNYNTHTDHARELLHWHALVQLDQGLDLFAKAFPFAKAGCPVLAAEKKLASPDFAKAQSKNSNQKQETPEQKQELEQEQEHEQEQEKQGQQQERKQEKQ